jgi:hypothetical protein
VTLPLKGGRAGKDIIGGGVKEMQKGETFWAGGYGKKENW